MKFKLGREGNEDMKGVRDSEKVVGTSVEYVSHQWNISGTERLLELEY